MAVDVDGGNNNGYDITTDASFENPAASSYLFWLWFDSAVGNQRLFYKGGFRDLGVIWNDANDIELSVTRATTTGWATSSANVIATGKWSCLACTEDTSDGPRIYHGDLSTSLVESASYSNRQTGVGAISDDSGSNAMFTYRDTNRSTNAKYAVFMQINRRLTLAELISLQWRPRVVASTAIYYQCGFDGAAVLYDLSGNSNNAAQAGTTAVADHVPLGPPFGARSGWDGAYTAPAGGLSIPVAMHHYTKNVRAAC